MKWWTLIWYYVGRKICYINSKALTRFSYNPMKKIKPKLYSKEDRIFIWQIELWKLMNIE